jgi:hypothetical protein
MCALVDHIGQAGEASSPSIGYEVVAPSEDATPADFSTKSISLGRQSPQSNVISTAA